MDIENLCPPEEPQPGDCCGSGCARCVWDVYFDALAEYEVKRKEAKEAPPSEKKVTLHSTTSLERSALPTQPTSYAGAVVVKFVEADSYDEYDEEFTLVDLSKAIERDGYKKFEVQPGATSLGELEKQPICQSNLQFAESFRAPNPGDVIEIIKANTTNEIELILSRMNIPSDRLVKLLPSPFKPPNSFPPWLPEKQLVSVIDLFKWKIEMHSTAWLRKPFLQMMAKYTSGDSEKQQLEELANSPALQQQLFAAFPTMASVFSKFPSCKPPLARLLECTTPMRPRSFSVASICGPTTVSILFRSISNIRGQEEGERVGGGGMWFGHVSPHLHQFPVPGEVQAPMKAKIVVAKHQLRTAIHAPQVLVAGGVGLAPILFQLQRRLVDAEEDETATIPAASYLFFGCRTQEELKFFANQWQPYVDKGILSKVFVAVSRSPEKKKEHVTDLLCQEMKLVKEIISEWEGSLVACGPTALISNVKTLLCNEMPGGVGWWKKGEADGKVKLDYWSPVPIE